MKSSILACARLSLAALFFALVLTASVSAQNGTPPPAAPTPQPTDAQTTPASTKDTTPDAAPAPPLDRTRRTLAQNTAEAWDILKTGAADPKKPDIRTAAVTAIGGIQGSRIAHKLLSDALVDPDVDVRTAAILGVGNTQDKGLYGKLREMLDDKDPGIAFTAAITLWKANDKSGEDILISVLEGDRKTDAGIIKGSERMADRDLHSPTKMAELGARQGIPMLFGPAGYGFAAWDYTHHHGGDNPRVTALQLLSEEKTANVHNSLLSALDDKDPQVRAAAARALGEYRDKATGINLLTTFTDAKLPVRFFGAAAYICISSGPAVHAADRSAKKIAAIVTPQTARRSGSSPPA
jgi:hypothetical protein